MPIEIKHIDQDSDLAVRPAYPAIVRGMKCRCPHCGRGRMFRAFLKVKDTCDECQTELHHHRADDFPAYLTIFIVGHIVVTMVMLVEARWELSTPAHLAIWVPLSIAMSLAILQPLKGGVVGFQWAARMHGFGGDET